MTAPHDKAGNGGSDALMAAITGEAPPREARADDAFLAEYRSATTDVALLREQLGLIGQALAEPPEEPGPETEGAAGVTPPSVRRRRPEPLAVALKGLVAAVGASLVIGMGWLVVHSGDLGAADDQGGSAASDSSAGRPHTEGDAKLSHAGYLACARLVVEGTVAGVEPLPGTGQDRITLDVTRYHKPDRGRARITFPMETGAEPPLRAGDHVLVGVSGGQAEPDLWATDEKEIARDRAWITEALPASRTFPCR
ncbi:hypothetical protein ACIQU3_06955 [Streptomyces sp. NPDC101110]|uniref:hypothetical protein n=1 Tax=Streptomyces sp. NPDC101110 TaxID=3366104 RepID=UPI00381B1529